MDLGAKTYTLDSLAELLNVPAERLRAWVRAGLVRPIGSRGDLAQFDFRQVSAAKSLCDLLASGVTLGRVRKGLQSLRAWKTESIYPLEQLAILERSGILLVRLEQGDLAEADGQYHFDFDQDQSAAPMQIMPGPRTPAEWYAQGLLQEQQSQFAEAAGSFRQALLDGGPDADVCFALANVLRQMGERQQAVVRRTASPAPKREARPVHRIPSLDSIRLPAPSIEHPRRDSGQSSGAAQYPNSTAQLR